MPIDFVIDHARRLVTARARGTLTHEDIFSYQKGVWSHAEVNGYDELVDMSQVDHIDLKSIEGVRELSKLSAGMDSGSTSSRFAIVAPTGEAFGLGRMYQTYRGLDKRSTKEVGVFQSLDEALAFLNKKQFV
jgi:hypothetical protein